MSEPPANDRKPSTPLTPFQRQWQEHLRRREAYQREMERLQQLDYRQEAWKWLMRLCGRL
jgi:hypothetical protein